MAALRLSVVLCWLMISTALQASESGDLLQDFGEMSLNSPTVAHENWSGRAPIDSDEFQQFYVRQFERYLDTATRLSLRAISCAEGNLPQAENYQSMTELKPLYVSITDKVTQAQAQLTLWQDLDDVSARERLTPLVSQLTVEYSRMMFELSGCSGYLSGELVN